MARRINVVLSDGAHRRLVREVPRGERSRLLEAALDEYLLRRGRGDSLRRLEALRSSAPAVPLREIVRELRRDRGRP